MSVQWNPYIQQRGVQFAIRESGFGRGRQVASVMAAPGSLNAQRVSVPEFNALLDSSDPRPPAYPLQRPYLTPPSYNEVPPMLGAPTYVPAGPSPTEAFTPFIVPVQSVQLPAIAASGALPPQSDFRSDVSYSAWWGYREGAIDQVCATQGAGFIKALRAALSLSPSSVWDVDVQNALVSKILTLASANPATWAGTVLQLRNDLAAQQISATSLSVGIYATYYQGSNRRLDAIVIYPGTALPVWGQAPADDRGLNGGAILCFDPNTETADAPAGGRASAIAESRTGIRVGPGRVTTGLSTVVDPNAQGVGPWGFLAAVAGIGFVLWAVIPRENPQLVDGSRAACLQRDIMAELHRVGLWHAGIRDRETTRGYLQITGLDEDSIRGTRIPAIAMKHGFQVIEGAGPNTVMFFDMRRNK